MPDRAGPGRPGPPRRSEYRVPAAASGAKPTKQPPASGFSEMVPGAPGPDWSTTSTRRGFGAQTRKWTPPDGTTSAPTGNLRSSPGAGFWAGCPVLSSIVVLDRARAGPRRRAVCPQSRRPVVAFGLHGKSGADWRRIKRVGVHREEFRGPSDAGQGLPNDRCSPEQAGRIESLYAPGGRPGTSRPAPRRPRWRSRSRDPADNIPSRRRAARDRRAVPLAARGCRGVPEWHGRRRSLSSRASRCRQRRAVPAPGSSHARLAGQGLQRPTQPG